MSRTRAGDYENKQSNILDSAASVFARLGMQKASMAEIARQGNISKSLLYHYYSSKEDLIFDIVRSHLSELDGALSGADRSDLPLEERLRLLIHSGDREVRGCGRQAQGPTQLHGHAPGGEIRATLRNRASDRAAILVDSSSDQSRFGGRARVADASHDVTLRHPELGLHVAPPRRTAHTTGICRHGDDTNPQGRKVGSASLLAVALPFRPRGPRSPTEHIRERCHSQVLATRVRTSYCATTAAS